MGEGKGKKLSTPNPIKYNKKVGILMLDHHTITPKKHKDKKKEKRKKYDSF